ncbi:MAG: cytochrome c oxidase assembly protein [Nakamurella sp.]
MAFVGELPPIDGAYATAWTTAWAPNAIMLVATVTYVVLLVRRKKAGRSWRGRLAAWMLAMGGLVVAFNSSVSLYSDTLFWVHMIQHLLLIMIVPSMLVWAEIWSIIPAGRGRMVSDLLDESGTWHTLTSPLFSVPLYAATVVLTHVTPFQQLAVTHPGIRIAENSLYLIAGYLLFAELIRGGQSAHRIPDLARIATIIAAMGADTLAGLALMLTQQVLAPAYAASHPGWGPSALTDQNTAGALMWVFGDVLMMGFMTVIGVLWGMRGDDAGVGDWLEAVRRRAMVGDQADALAHGPTIDIDQAALDVYNARLAELNRHDIAQAAKNPAAITGSRRGYPTPSPFDGRPN